MALRPQEDVGGLDVPVDDALSVQELQHGAQLPDHLPELLFRQLCGAGALAFYIFFDYASEVIGDRDLIQLRQIGMGAFLQHPVNLMPSFQPLPHIGL